MNITSDWNNHLDEIEKHILAMQRLALNCGDIMQSAALLKTIEWLKILAEENRLNINDEAGAN